MRRHNPTLYSHQEHGYDDDDEEHAAVPYPGVPVRPPPPSVAPSTRPKMTRSQHSYSTNSGNSSTPSPHVPPSYSDLYSTFVRRYRAQPDDDPRNDPDSHYFQRGLGQLLDETNDSDEEERTSIGPDVSPYLHPELDASEATSREDRERLEWQTMLASVLDGDVLRSEKTRIAVALESSAEEQNNVHYNIWLGIRAKLHRVTEDEERIRVEDRRLRTIDPVLAEIARFCLDDDVAKDPSVALRHVKALLRRLEAAQTLYPNLKTFYQDKPAALDPDILTRIDTLNTWSSVLSSLQHQLNLLKRWTGSETLDVTQPHTSHEIPIGTSFGPDTPLLSSNTVDDGTNFVERVLKEDSLQRTFEKGFLTTVHGIIGTARDAQVNGATLFRTMNLPTFERELVPLISFPTRLVQAILRVRLNYVEKLRDPEIIIIDQVTEDLKLNIGLACTLKRQYEAFLSPDPGGNWQLPQCISEDYDDTILEALKIFFRLIHWKLKSGLKGIYFKETDVLDAQWATFNDVSLATQGGSVLVADQIWYSTIALQKITPQTNEFICSALTNKLMVRVTNYFETQVRVPAVDDVNTGLQPGRQRMRAVQTQHNSVQPHNTPVSKPMTDEQLASWYGKILEGVRLRYRKLQRFARSRFPRHLS